MACSPVVLNVEDHDGVDISAMKAKNLGNLVENY
jgi:hypothetical protein